MIDQWRGFLLAFGLVLLLFAAPAWAQTLAPVPEQTQGGGIIVLVLLVAGGLVFLRVKKPETFAKLMGGAKKAAAEAKPALAQIEHTFTDLWNKGEAGIAGVVGSKPTQTGSSPSVVTDAALFEEWKRLHPAAPTGPAIPQAVPAPRFQYVNGVKTLVQ